MALVTVLLSLMAICAGMLFPLQTAINARLAAGVGGPIVATLISFLAGLVALLVLVIATTRGSLDGAALRQPPWLLMAGGFLGAAYLCLNVVLVPRIGAAAMMGLAIAGQMIAALLIDSQGLFGLATREMSVGRVAGVILVVSGAFLVRFF